MRFPWHRLPLQQEWREHTAVWHQGNGDDCTLKLGAALIDLFRSRKHFHTFKMRAFLYCAHSDSMPEGEKKYIEMSGICADWPHHSFSTPELQISQFPMTIAAQAKEKSSIKHHHLNQYFRFVGFCRNDARPCLVIHGHLNGIGRKMGW